MKSSSRLRRRDLFANRYNEPLSNSEGHPTTPIHLPTTALHLPFTRSSIYFSIVISMGHNVQVPSFGWAGIIL